MIKKSVLLLILFSLLKIVYATNLLDNPGFETGDFTNWTIVSNGGSGILVGTSGACTVHSGTYAAYTSFAWDVVAQTINLTKLGYSTSYLDTSPTIDIEAYASGSYWSSVSKPGQYYLKVELRDANQNVITTLQNGTQASPISLTDSSWVRVSGQLTNYNTGLRYIYFEQGGKDTLFWAGNYGPSFDDANVSFLDSPNTTVPEYGTSFFILSLLLSVSFIFLLRTSKKH